MNECHQLPKVEHADLLGALHTVTNLPFQGVEAIGIILGGFTLLAGAGFLITRFAVWVGGRIANHQAHHDDR